MLPTCLDCNKRLMRDGSSRGNKYFFCGNGHRWVLRKGETEFRRSGDTRFIPPPCPECASKLRVNALTRLPDGGVIRYFYCESGHRFVQNPGEEISRPTKRRGPKRAVPPPAAITSENIILTCMNWSSQFTKNWEEKLRHSMTQLSSMAPSRVHTEPMA